MDVRSDNYSGIARHYDTQKMDWFATMFGDRLLSLLEERHIGPGRLLDAGCGTGSLALKMASSSWTVTGVDLSMPLLEVARSKDAEGRVRWVEQDLTRLDIGGTFDLITSVADVFNHFERIDDWERAFSRLAHHLEPSGALLLDVMTCRGLENLDVYSTTDRASGVLIVGAIWEPPARRSTVKITSFVPTDRPALYERASTTIPEWGHPVADISRALVRAGFAEPERVWGIASDPEEEDRVQLLAVRESGRTGNR